MAPQFTLLISAQKTLKASRPKFPAREELRQRMTAMSVINPKSLLGFLKFFNTIASVF